MSRGQMLSRMSVEEYLKFEETSDIKHEYLDGHIFAMTDVTLAHNGISLNIVSALNPQLKETGSQIYMAAVKLRISENTFYYPDVLINCGEYRGTDVFIESPAMIFEVSAPSTAAIDQREKLVAYLQLPSLKSYVVVRQSRKHITVYSRLDEQNWTVQELASNEEFEVQLCPDTKVRLAVDDVYEDTDISDNMTVKEDDELYIW